MTIKEITYCIQNKLFSSADELESILHSIKGHLIIPAITMAAGVPLYRATRISNLAEVTSIDRLSYKPAHLNNTFGRASTPNHTMFYGISATNTLNALCSCLGEVCPCVRDYEPPKDYYMIVLSKWVLKKDFLLATIVDVDGNNRSNELKDFFSYDEFLASISLLPNSCDVIEFWRMMNREFTKRVTEEQDYMVSACFSELIMSMNLYDGIIYESVQSTDEKLKESLCVAIPPSVVNNYLEYETADLYEFDFVNIATPISPRITKKNILQLQ